MLWHVWQHVCVWDDDSQDGGKEGDDDAMGQANLEVTAAGAKVHRLTLDGIGAFYSSKISFEYDIELPEAPRPTSPWRQLPANRVPPNVSSSDCVRILEAAEEVVLREASYARTALSEHQLLQRAAGTPSEEQGVPRPRGGERARIAAANDQSAVAAIATLRQVAFAADYQLESLLCSQLLLRASAAV